MSDKPQFTADDLTMGAAAEWLDNHDINHDGNYEMLHLLDLCQRQALQITLLHHDAKTWSNMCDYNWQLEADIERLLAAIRKHRDYRGDQRCHLDDGELYAVLPEGDTRPERETAVTLENCQRFIECRQQGREYISPQVRIEELEAEVARLRDQNRHLSILVEIFAEPPMTPEQAEAELAACADEPPLSEERIEEIVQHVLKHDKPEDNLPPLDVVDGRQRCDVCGEMMDLSATEMEWQCPKCENRTYAPSPYREL